MADSFRSGVEGGAQAEDAREHDRRRAGADGDVKPLFDADEGGQQQKPSRNERGKGSAHQHHGAGEREEDALERPAALRVADAGHASTPESSWSSSATWARSPPQTSSHSSKTDSSAMKHCTRVPCFSRPTIPAWASTPACLDTFC